MFGFGSVRSKGIKAGIAAIKPMLGALQGFGGPGIPPGMWQDPYVLGFVNATINVFAKMYTNGKAEGGELGYIMIGVYEAASHQNAMAIVQLATDFGQQQHPDFVRGIEDAMLISLYGQRRLKHENDPLIIRATTDAAALGQPNDRTAIAGLMLLATWNKEVRRLANR